MSLVLQSSGGGSVTLEEAVTASNLTITVPAVTGTMAIQGPAFSAYSNATQSITTSTLTKVAINTEEFDTNSNFDTTNYRFTPTVAGYYQVNGTVRCAGTSPSQIIAILYKNGSSYSRGVDLVGTSLTISTFQATYNEVVYLNGTTDYIELYGYITATTPSFNFANSTATSRFSACLIRGA